MLYVKYDRAKALINGKADVYESWAKDYKVDLSKPFRVFRLDHSDGDKPDYFCEPPPSLKDQSQGVYVGSKAFSPVPLDINLEDYL